eukprot:SAG31_NODE_20573_length_570_cov_1.798301_1_plen_68_part_10
MDELESSSIRQYRCAWRMLPILIRIFSRPIILLFSCVQRWTQENNIIGHSSIQVCLVSGCTLHGGRVV